MRRALAVLLLAAGCSRDAAPPPGAAVYTPRDRSFSFHAPEDWRVLEDQGGTHRVTLFGPGGQAIAVHRHVEGDPRGYLLGAAMGSKRATPPEEGEISGRKTLTTTVERAMPGLHGGRAVSTVEKRVVVVDRGGFWVFTRTTGAGQPVDEAPFELVLRSFKAR